jgi:gliding motility-associated-like protein
MNRIQLFFILFFSCLHVYSQEICNNGIDDDGDGLIDFADYECNGWPDPYNFNTGNNGTGGTLPIGSADLNWTASSTGITGSYNPTYIIIPNPAYVNSPWPNSVWISDDSLTFFTSGQVYYKTIINIPPTDICGNPIAPSYCLNFSFFCDNSVDSIWLNGVLQNISPNPCFTGCEYGFQLENERTVNICSDWINGNNELIVKVFNQGGPGAFLAYRTPTPPPSFTGVDSIIGSAFTFCAQATTPVQLTSLSNSGIWSGPGVSPTGLFTPSLLGLGTYQINYESVCSADSVLITVVGAPVATAQTTMDSVCIGNSVQFDANGGVSYAWFPSTNLSSSTLSNPTAIINNSITYNVIVEDVNGCSDTASVSISTLPTVEAGFTMSDPNGCVPLCIDFTNTSTVSSGSITNYFWSLENGITSTDTNITSCFTSPGIYTASLIAISNAGCIDTFVLANAINAGTVDASFSIIPNSNVYVVNEILNFQNTTADYVISDWDFAGMGSSVLPNPSFSFADTGTYCIKLFTATSSGCEDTVVRCIRIQDEFNLFFPNAFTPNLDEINPIWRLYGTGIKSIQAYIYNRWGQEIFTINNINGFWNGEIQGVDCPAGIYSVLIYATDFKNKEYSYIDRISLLR